MSVVPSNTSPQESSDFHVRVEQRICEMQGQYVPRILPKQLENKVQIIVERVLNSIVFQNEASTMFNSSFSAATSVIVPVCRPGGLPVLQILSNIYKEKKDEEECLLRVICEVSTRARNNSIPFKGQFLPNYYDIISAATIYAVIEIVSRLD